MKKDGRIVVDVGENRKREFKAKLSLYGLSIKKWLQDSIDKYLESEGK